MSSLSDKEIFELIEKKQLSISPLDPNNVQPGSIDLTLGRTVDHWECSPDETLDLTLEDNKKFIEEHFRTIDITDGYVLEPNDFVRGYSAETVKLPSFINGIIVNRNSLCSVGLDVSISQYINPSFKKNKIIVIRNISKNKIKIKSGLRICQLILFRMESESIREYSNRHSLESLKEFIDIQNAQKNKHMDHSLSEFMDKRIDEIAAGKV
ncbi:MAG: 2'-deoxycytidine 5'-triphosphate deaminase domain-containing protein [Succinivibrio sp.]